MPEQKVLTCSTSNCGMKSSIEGWSYYDGNAVREATLRHPHKDVWDEKNVWVITSKPSYDSKPATPFHAIAMGWKLLAPPTKHVVLCEGGSVAYEEWEWWFTKEADLPNTAPTLIKG